jgi:phage terminase large subunit GpA-like protein
MVYHVGTVAAKHWLYSRISTDAEKEEGARLCHFSDELGADFFQGLASETYNPAKNRFEKKRGARNEPLDTWVYAYAAAHHPEVRLHRLTKADWDRIEQTILARAAKTKTQNQSLQLDKTHATIVPVAVEDNPKTTTAVNEQPSPPDADPAPAKAPKPAPARASKLPPLPRKGSGWIKKW